MKTKTFHLKLKLDIHTHSQSDKSFPTSCMGNLRPAGQIRPAKASHPARQEIF